jgi:EAL and modified HD-GYP domain-containing signal transduction protein
MGEVEVKKFIAPFALAKLGDEKSEELMHLSLVRAKFCEILAHSQALAIIPPRVS